MSLNQSPVARFNALDSLLAISLQEGETLAGLISRVEEAFNNVRLMRPQGSASKTYALKDLDDELCSMALIKALPQESFSNFRSSLLLMTDVSFKTVKEAFIQEQKN